MKGIGNKLKSGQFGLKSSIFSEMTALALSHSSLNLGQGFPDFSPDAEIFEAVNKAMKGGANQYAPFHGSVALREQISLLAKRLYSADYDPNTEITVTSGGTEGLFCALAASLKEGDEAIFFEPAYDSYVPVIELFGAKPVPIKLQFPSYSIDWDHVKKAVNARTRVIILNSPQNPTGSVLSAQDMEQLSRIVKSNNIVVISDEVYEHILFDGLEHQSVARYPELAGRAFIISSFGKSFHVTGWKVGYCLAPVEYTSAFRAVHQYNVFCTAHPFQVAFAGIMKNEDAFSSLASFYQTKRDFFLKAIAGSGFKPLACSGTYFQLLSYKGLSDESDIQFAKRLTIEKGITAIPISGFYSDNEDNQVLRFCFAKKEETLSKAGEIIKNIK